MTNLQSTSGNSAHSPEEIRRETQYTLYRSPVHRRVAKHNFSIGFRLVALQKKLLCHTFFLLLWPKSSGFVSSHHKTLSLKGNMLVHDGSWSHICRAWWCCFWSRYFFLAAILSVYRDFGTVRTFCSSYNLFKNQAVFFTQSDRYELGTMARSSYYRFSSRVSFDGSNGTHMT